MDKNELKKLRLADTVEAKGWGTVVTGIVVGIKLTIRGRRIKVFTGTSLGSYARKNVTFIRRETCPVELIVRKFIDQVMPELSKSDTNI